MTTWGDLFDRAEPDGVTVAAVRETLAERRERRAGESGDRAGGGGSGGGSGGVPEDPDPTLVVADADVLAADLLAGGPARAALDRVREHSWMDLVASDALLADAEAVIAALADVGLAADWRGRVERERVPVEHPAGDHPGLASAYRAGAAHLLTYDEGLASVRTGLSVQPYAGLSVRHPDAFATVFDAAGLYGTVADDEYPGPDRDPRS